MGTKSKLRNKQSVFKTNSVPVQPPIENIIKIEGGVSLKTQNTTIKGAEKKGNKIENLSRTEYNEYIEKLRYIPKTHTFDTRMSANKKNKSEEKDDKDEENEMDNVKTIKASDLNIDTDLNASPKSHRSSTSRMRKMRIDHTNTPRSPKLSRGQQSQTTDRLISEYNKASLFGGDSMDF